MDSRKITETLALLQSIPYVLQIESYEGHEFTKGRCSVCYRPSEYYIVWNFTEAIFVPQTVLYCERCSSGLFALLANVREEMRSAQLQQNADREILFLAKKVFLMVSYLYRSQELELIDSATCGWCCRTNANVVFIRKNTSGSPQSTLGVCRKCQPCYFALLEAVEGEVYTQWCAKFTLFCAADCLHKDIVIYTACIYLESVDWHLMAASSPLLYKF